MILEIFCQVIRPEMPNTIDLWIASVIGGSLVAVIFYLNRKTENLQRENTKIQADNYKLIKEETKEAKDLAVSFFKEEDFRHETREKLTHIAVHIAKLDTILKILENKH